MTIENSAGRALITGASSGIGRELAREFARHGHPVLLVAPVAAELRLLADELEREFGVHAQPLALDLTQAGAIAELAAHPESADVEILVNNAGLGQRGKFWETPLDRDLDMIRLNIEAVVRLTKHFLPLMVNRGHGRILNTASIAGFEPGPLLAVYHASKAFVLSWSQALSIELEGTGVTATALCPGPTDTDFFPKADLTETNAFQKANVMPPQEVAEIGYRALMQGEAVEVAGGLNKAMVASRRLMPKSVQARKNRKLYSRSGSQKRQRGDIEAKDSAQQA